MPSTLAADVSTRLTALSDRLECAQLVRQADQAPGALRVQADCFMAAASQHLAGVTAVLAPAAVRLEDGQDRVRLLIEDARGLERALVSAKARLYGQAQNARRSWREIWSDVRTHLDKVAGSEAAVVDLLEGHLELERLEELSRRFGRAVVQAQTRPHPYMPHLGRLGRMARRLCATTDRVWDELEGRVTTNLAQAS